MANRVLVLEEILQKSALVEIIAYFETAFQMSILYFVQNSGFDRDDVIKRLENMSIEMDSSHIFDTIGKAVFEKNIESVKEVFPILKTEAEYYALFEYIKSDKELLNPEIYYRSMEKEIYSGEFFRKDIDELIDSEFPYRVKVWEEIINEKLCSEIKEVIINDRF